MFQNNVIVCRRAVEVQNSVRSAIVYIAKSLMHCCRRRVYACVFVYGWGECGFEKKTDDGSGEFADERGWETIEITCPDTIHSRLVWYSLTTWSWRCITQTCASRCCFHCSVTNDLLALCVSPIYVYIYVCRYIIHRCVYMYIYGHIHVCICIQTMVVYMSPFSPGDCDHSYACQHNTNSMVVMLSATHEAMRDLWRNTPSHYSALTLPLIWYVVEVEEQVWEDAGFPKIRQFNGWAADGGVGVMLVIAKRIEDSEDKRVSFVCPFLDGWHSSFHIYHGVESETKIVKLLCLLQESG